MKKYDVVFVSNGEENAEENWNTLLTICPDAKRINNVPGIHAAYQAAGQLAETEHVYLVDADNQVFSEFDFQAFVFSKSLMTVPHVITWKTKNRVNSLIYGHGGITLYPTALLRDTSRAGADVASTLGVPIRSIPIIASIHAFDFNKYNTWRTAFREGVKLKRSSLDGSCMHARWRLHVWMNEGFGDFGEYSKDGAEFGASFFEKYPNAVSLINDEAEMKNIFSSRFRTQ